MFIWFIHNQIRLNSERLAIETLIQKNNWLINDEWILDGGKLCLLADIAINEKSYPIKMVYPATYPASPPTVKPREANQHWSEHQYGSGGELCLEWGPDNWQEEISGADILKSAYKLLSTENSSEKNLFSVSLPSRHNLTIGQQLKNVPLRFVCDESLRQFANSVLNEIIGNIEFEIIISNPSTVIFVREIKTSLDTIWKNLHLPQKLSKDFTQLKGLFLKTNLESNKVKSLDIKSLHILLKRKNYDVSQLSQSDIHLALIVDKVGIPHLFFCLNDEEITHLPRLDIQVSKSRLNPEFSNLVNKTVGIVGVGSAGSKMADSLARSGIKKFILIDYDILMPENICRHTLNWESIGQHKVDALANNLKLISQDMEISCYRLMLSGQESTASVDGILSLLGKCDLIIDASANPTTFNQLSHVAHQCNTPLIWLEIFAGGIGGLIARFRPTHDPTPKLMRAYLLEYLDKQVAPKIKATKNYTAINNDDEFIIASDADVTIISANATRMALDILVENKPSVFPYSMYLIGLSKGWIFKEPFYTIPIDYTDIKSNSNRDNLSNEEKSEITNFIMQLIEKQQNDNLPST